MTKKFLHRSLLVAILALLSACSSHSGPSDRAAPNASSSGAPRTSKGVDTARLSGLVIKIVDGDTIDVLDSQQVQYRVRLQGIDAPERRQAFYDVSRDYLASLISGKDVTVEWRQHDKYGRIVGKVLLNGDDVCLEQVKSGLAWHYKKYENEQSEEDRHLYAEAEREARSQKVGLWSDPNPIPPWDFKHPGESNADNDGESNSSDRGDSTPNGRDESASDNHSASTSAGRRASSSNSTSTSSNPAAVSSGNAGQVSGLIRGNKNSMIYHRPDCPDYDKIAPHNRIPFKTREEAERAGYRPAKNCQ